ncbi:hypothetical protein ABW19_dt0203572 [Dactylella cylindrospora]|nr:hypothetical protein ABW19_dt0203572 [Dactylella cylindrospora]
MSITTTVSKVGIWIIRFLQFCFAVILTGIFAWFHHRISEAQHSSIEDVDVPLSFSVAAIFFTTASIITIFCLNGALSWIFAFIDFALWGGYLASSILYRHNFHVHCADNPLGYYLVNAEINGGSWRKVGEFRNCNLVRLGAALIIIQVILFFVTMIISTFVAVKGNKPAAGEPTPVTSEKRRFFHRRSGQTIGSTGTSTPPASAV